MAACAAGRGSNGGDNRGGTTAGAVNATAREQNRRGEGRQDGSCRYLRTQIDKVSLGASLAAPVEAPPMRLSRGAFVPMSRGRKMDGTKRASSEMGAYVHSSFLSLEGSFSETTSPMDLPHLAPRLPQRAANGTDRSSAGRLELQAFPGDGKARLTGVEPVARGFAMGVG